jgi:acylphosphatase
MDTKRVHVIVEGRVQGVFFRAFTRDEAVRLGLSGWVRNRPNGSVEAVVEGEKSAVGKMRHIQLLKKCILLKNLRLAIQAPLKFIIIDCSPLGFSTKAITIWLESQHFS